MKRPVWFLLFLLAGAHAADAGVITLTWDPSVDATAGYIVYAGAQPAVYSQSFDVGGATSFVFPNAVAGQRYCFAVTAYSEARSESPRSNEVCGFSNAPPTLNTPPNQSSVVGQSAQLQLQASDPYGEPLSFSATGLPPGLSVSQSTGLIAGVGSTGGTYSVTVAASDGVLSDAKSFTWTMGVMDTAPPSVTISSPTSSASYTTNGPAVSVAGTSSDANGVRQVSWVNDRGGSGVASGTSSWNAASIPLQSGANTITVLARDAAGNEGRDALTVTFEISAAPTMLSAQPIERKNKRVAELRWTNCPWSSVDVYRNGARLTNTANSGTYSDNARKTGTYTYRICQPNNAANCSNSVVVIF